MYGNDYKATDPVTVRIHSSLREVCGRWVSLSGSPEVRIFFTGMHYRLEFSYDVATVFTCPILRQREAILFYLYGRINISYDDEREVLLLSDYGEYVRAEE